MRQERYERGNRRLYYLSRQPGGLGSFGSGRWLLGGSEDPWLCVSSFGWICLYRSNYEARGRTVNSGLYLSSAFGCGLFSGLPEVCFRGQRHPQEHRQYEYLTSQTDPITPRQVLESTVSEKRDCLAGIVRSVEADAVPLETKVLTGKPFIEMIRQVLRDEHDLIIKCAHVDRGLGQMLFSSTDALDAQVPVPGLGHQADGIPKPGHVRGITAAAH